MHTKKIIMRSNEEEECSEAPKLPLISFASSPKLSLLLQESSSDDGEESDMVETLPSTSAASVPFLWEEEPGKPRPCTPLITNTSLPNNIKYLDLPPRLQQTDFSRLVTKTPSPATVFEGPYVQAKSVFSSLSFRFNASKRRDSFDTRSSKSPDTVQIFLDPTQLHHHHLKGGRRKGLSGSLGLNHKNAKVEGSEMEFVSEDNFVFSPLFMDDALSPTTKSRSHFWTTMYKGFKHAIPWKGKK